MSIDANTINILMHLDPLELSAQNIDDIITYNRQLLTAYEKGEKVTQDLPKIDLTKIGLAKPLEIKRRKGL